ncbi:hypothetical protein ZIOFF_034760 [Zingiber officinale]|uniref:Uncharacterized protein n=1 Tax=Zingiber officinale TaxID=94328 RepID=A0A8J5L6B2_ZINOF|nr:hypothetical protein ZIOFF_034760 [Zingiber officinale]
MPCAYATPRTFAKYASCITWSLDNTPRVVRILTAAYHALRVSPAQMYVKSSSCRLGHGQCPTHCQYADWNSLHPCHARWFAKSTSCKTWAWTTPHRLNAPLLGMTCAHAMPAGNAKSVSCRLRLRQCPEHCYAPRTVGPLFGMASAHATLVGMSNLSPVRLGLDSPALPKVRGLTLSTPHRSSSGFLDPSSHVGHLALAFRVRSCSASQANSFVKPTPPPRLVC